MTATACTSSTASETETPTSVPTSAAVTPAPGAPVRTAPGTALLFGQSAVLPANAFAAQGPSAMFTVTGITPAEGVPDSTTKGGVPYFLYVTVTSLAARPAAAPTATGLAGSADGKTPALTLAPTPGLAKCPVAAPPEKMRRGDSYALCLVAVADEGTKLRQVIYWADTSGDPRFDYKSGPVVWAPPAPPTSASTPATG
ncbi:hypothetical protein AAFP30_18045 [Gordonia sp. CPCC 205515]|uniref:hypothetical protein n=1 Tax=Gordonia sp. CPCC 205515 TaxID=3140791 RepID=UPI003AF36DA0